MNSAADLGKAPVSSLVLRLAIPAMIAQFVNVLYSIIDRMYIGHIPAIGPDALAGVGVCGPIVTLLSSFGTLVGIGGSILFGIRLGEKNIPKARQILSNAFLMLTCFSLVLTAAFLLLKDQLLMWFGASSVTFAYADTYLTIYTAGTFFALMATGLNYFINSQGFPLAGMATVLIGAVFNILLDPLFIFVFHMDVAGAAIATVISQMASCAFALSFLFSKKVKVRITFGGYSRRLMGRILYLGMSPFLILATDSVLLIVMNTVLQTYGGPSQGDMLITCATIVQSYMQLSYFSHDRHQRRQPGDHQLQLRRRGSQKSQKDGGLHPEADAGLHRPDVYYFPFPSPGFCAAVYLRAGIHGFFRMGHPDVYPDDYSTQFPVCFCGFPHRPGADQNSSGPLRPAKIHVRGRNHTAASVFRSCLRLLRGAPGRRYQFRHNFRGISAAD